MQSCPEISSLEQFLHGKLDDEDSHVDQHDGVFGHPPFCRVDMRLENRVRLHGLIVEKRSAA